MKIKKLSIMLPIIFLRGEEFRNTYKTEKGGREIQESSVTIAILQVGIEVVLIAFAIQTIVVDYNKPL